MIKEYFSKANNYALCIVLCALYLAMLSATAMAQGYRNPIIPGYHPDPSVCRVGSDFYLVNSSFQYFPGVPIFKSKDMVNWEQIGNVLDRESQIPLKGASSWLGIYAPTIRYHEGTYYMVTTNVGNGGNFFVTSKSPSGPWSEPIWVAQDGIDPSLWFEDGKCYFTSNPNNSIVLSEIDVKTGKLLTDGKVISQGTGGRYPEGAHIYKKDGYYYLLISEGGTELAHSLTIARSKNIDGPYESYPANPIFTHCRMAAQDNQIQGTGHGDFVQAEDGSWWLVMLGYRNFGGSYHHMGRETFLAPVEWKEGEWPVVNGGNSIDTLMNVKTLPLQPVAPKKYSLDGDKPRAEWLYIQNPIKENYEYGNGKVRLHASKSTLTENNQPTFMGVRQESDKFTMSVTIDPRKLSADSEAGLTVYQINNGHSDIFVRPNNSGSLCSVVVRHTIKSLVKEDVVATFANTSTTLTIQSDGNTYSFGYTHDGKTENGNNIETSLLSTEVVGGFTGVILGMYATGEGYADFSELDLAVRK